MFLNLVKEKHREYQGRALSNLQSSDMPRFLHALLRYWMFSRRNSVVNDSGDARSLYLAPRHRIEVAGGAYGARGIEDAGGAYGARVYKASVRVYRVANKWVASKRVNAWCTLQHSARVARCRFLCWREE